MQVNVLCTSVSLHLIPLLVSLPLLISRVNHVPLYTTLIYFHQHVLSIVVTVYYELSILNHMHLNFYLTTNYTMMHSVMLISIRFFYDEILSFIVIMLVSNFLFEVLNAASLRGYYYISSVAFSVHAVENTLVLDSKRNYL